LLDLFHWINYFHRGLDRLDLWLFVYAYVPGLSEKGSQNKVRGELFSHEWEVPKHRGEEEKEKNKGRKMKGKERNYENVRFHN
jgi:hypothetical protein